MKKNLFLLCFFFNAVFAPAQVLNFDQINSITGSGKALNWSTSAFGNGFGHRWVNSDPGNFTTLNLQYRHNSTIWNDAMVITSLGNIGIGTNNPANLGGWGRVVEIKHNDHSKFLVSTGINSVTLALYAHSNWDGPRGLIGTESSHDLSIITGYTNEAIRVKTNGNIGIGTVSPTHKLEVNGTIKTKEVNVTTTGWADYVFKPEYNLMSLAELESYILENRHLPNVPSEKEVLENGVNLLEMNVKLLEKVEELTLYIIQLKKEFEEYKAVQNK